MLLMWSGRSVDSTAPVLSSPSMASLTYQGGVPTVTTNEANGTLYYAVLTDGGSATNAQIKAGTGGNIVSGKAGNQAVTTTGVQTFSAVTGLSDLTSYEVVFLQTDTAGNDSTQSTAGFTTQGTSQFLIYPYFIDVSDSASPAVVYYSNHINASDSTRGITFAIKEVNPPAGGSIRCINNCYESEFRPGVVYPFAPDVTSGTVTTFTDGNTQFKNIASADKLTAYMEWLVPATAPATQDKLFFYPEANTNGNFDIIRNRGGSLTTIASNITVTGTSVAAPQLVALSSTIVPGDYVRYQLNSGASAVGRVGHIQTYDSTGSCTNKAQQWIAITQTSRVSIWMAGSTAEGAFSIAPTGSAPQFVGGEAHQGPAGTYGQEFPSTTTWTKGGASWTPAQGQWIESVVMSRASTLYYNVGNTDIGSLDISYKMDAFGLTVTNAIQADVAWDTGSQYWCMLPTSSAGWTQGGCTVAGVGVDKEEFTYASIVSSGFKFFSAPYATASEATTYNILTPAGFSICAYNKKAAANTVVSRDTEDKSGTQLKNYEELTQFADPNAIGTTYGGSMVFFQDAATGPSAASIAVAQALV